MLKFSKQQKVLEISEVKIGGQPGENPTVLIGGIFHHKHRIVKDEKTGDFHKEDAVKLIRLQEEISEKKLEIPACSMLQVPLKKR